MAASKAQNTVRAYASAWKIFRAWCEDAGLEPMPATPNTVSDFAVWTLEQGLHLQTVCLRLKAISYRHREANLPSPTRTDEVRLLLRNAARELKEGPRGKAPVTPEQLRKIVALACEKPAQIRNRAALLLAFASGWRRSEISAINRCDVVFLPAKGIRLWQGSSKTDQIGKGRYVGIHYGEFPSTCPVRALRSWLKLRGEWEGPLFTGVLQNGTVTRKRIDCRGEFLYRAIKRWMERIGEDPRRFGGHSTRRGHVSAAAERGASYAAIKLCTGHKSTKQLEDYIEPSTAFSMGNTMAGVL